MKLLMLGASKAQLQGIKQAKALGHQVYTCDYLKDAPGHRISDGRSLASSFDAQGVMAAAQTFGVDGIMTMGTDQPVYTAALAQEQLGLPKILDVAGALAVTNKKVMKKKFTEAGLPTMPYAIIGKKDGVEAYSGLSFPVVLKPVDSQGQRGIFLTHSPEEAVGLFDEVAAYSREDHILAEEYYEHEEVTVSGWMDQGKLHVLSITDRVTFDSPEQIGICLGHVFPTKFRDRYGHEIIELSEKIVDVFEIREGPVYFQMLIGVAGIRINEIACRIGGAYEGVLLPALTGFDICDAVVRKSLGLEADLGGLTDYDFMTCDKVGVVELFFAERTTLASIPDERLMARVPGLLEWDLNYGPGDVIGNIENATARAGYGVLTAASRLAMAVQLTEFYDAMKLMGTDGRNHVIHRPLNNSMTHIN